MTMDENFWVFGYGSLMWRPDFCFIRKMPARLFGYHRRFCVYSWDHRGTPDRPGLVLGLDRGGSCWGIAYQVASAQKARVVEYLDERELVTPTYRAADLAVSLPGGRARARCYVVDRAAPRYAGRLSIPEQAAIILGATGVGGHNVEYLRNTARHLMEMGWRNDPVHETWAYVRRKLPVGARVD